MKRFKQLLRNFAFTFGLILTVTQDQDQALSGATTGALLGAVVGPLLVGFFLGGVALLMTLRDRGR